MQDFEVQASVSSGTMWRWILSSMISWDTKAHLSSLVQNVHNYLLLIIFIISGYFHTNMGISDKLLYGVAASLIQSYMFDAMLSTSQPMEYI